MGGHGGLNILPQKRWNVYGQRNRLKVHEDESRHAEKQKTERVRHEKAEREFKTNLLRKRAHTEASTAVEHINFFEEEERQQEHEEVKREREEEDRKRGRRSDRTSDAHFDKRFAFIHGLNDTKPWYARPVSRTVESTPPAKPEQQSYQAASPSKDAPENDKRSKKDKKKKKARALLKELKKSNFKKAEIDVALLRIERLRREKKERSRAERLGKHLPQDT